MLVLLLACTGTSLQFGDGGDTGAAGGSRPNRGVEEAGEAPGAGEEQEDPVEPEFFDDSFVHEVEITLTNDAERDLGRDPYEFVAADVVVDGNSFPRVGVRLRGKIGSFRTLSGKPKFKIDFNRYLDDQRLGVHEALALNNEVVDCSYLKEPVGYAVFRQLGLPAPRTAFTHVTVNGADYGLYVGVEYPDDTFLDDHYADPSGNLYDGKYLYYDNGSYELIDFTPELAGDFQLEEGEDVGNADMMAIADAYLADGSWEDRMSPVLDTDQFHRHLAAEQWVGHLDGYTLNTNNYRVYVDPEDGRADLLVYDLDYAFLDASGWGMNWATPRGVVAQGCWYEAECRGAQGDAAAEVADEVDTDALLAQLDAWVELTAQAAADDPRRECAIGDVLAYQAGVRAWVDMGSDNLRAYWGR